MNTTTRKLLSIATTAASLGIGVFSARAINPAEDESEGIVMPVENTVPVDGVLTPTDNTIVVDGIVMPVEDVEQVDLPIVAPVFIGDDPAILEQLLADPPAIPEGEAGSAGYQGADSEVIGAITGQVAYAQSGDESDDPFEGQQIHVQSLPYVFDSIADQYIQFPVHAFDLCAGNRRGVVTSVARNFRPRSPCPLGFAGTLNGLLGWPAGFIRGEAGHRLASSGGITQTCPADTPDAGPGQSAATAFSSIPLVGNLRVDWRPYRTMRRWDSIDIPPTSAAHTAHWTAQREAGRYSNAALLPHCFLLDTNPDLSYEVRVFGIDADGNNYQSEVFVLWSPTIARPPTVADLEEFVPAVNVTSWTVAGGSVTFTTRAMVSDGDTACSGGGDAPTRFSPRVIDDSPADALVEGYPRRVLQRINLEIGTTLLCANIFDVSGNPIGTDTIVVRIPSLLRPVITLAGIRLNAGVTAAPNTLTVFGGDPLCGNEWRNDSAVTGTVSGDIAVIWDCGSGAFEGARDTSGARRSRPTPIYTQRRIFGPVDELRYTLRAIPVGTAVSCTPPCPLPPTEWYEVPIPTTAGEHCGDFGGTECPASEGLAILRLDYQTVVGADLPIDFGGTGETATTTLISSTTPAGVAPTLTVVGTTVERSPVDWSAIPVTLNITSDQIVELSNFDTFGDSERVECQSTAGGFTIARGTDLELNLEVCAGTDYDLVVYVLDDAGFEWEIPLGVVQGIPAVVADAVHTKVEFIGGEAPAFGYLEYLNVTLDDQSAALRYNWSGTVGSPTGPFCIAIADAVGDSSTDPPITVSGGGLTLFVQLGFSDVGETECVVDTTYRADTHFGPVDFDLAQLATGEPLVAESASDAYRALRITVTGSWHLVYP